MPWKDFLQKLTLVTILRKQGRETSKWLAYTLVGGLLPLWGGYVLTKLFNKVPAWSDFTDHGEFAIYSAAILAPALYSILKDFKTSTFIGRGYFGLICAVLLLGATVIFAGVTTVGTVSTGGTPLELNKGFLRDSTTWLFASSVVLAFLVTAIDSASVYKDIREVHNQELRELGEEFDRTER